mgnify:CR=1 FL=1
MILQEKLLHFFPILSKPESYVAKFSFVLLKFIIKKILKFHAMQT